jgi:hypothetical protein
MLSVDGALNASKAKTRRFRDKNAGLYRHTFVTATSPKRHVSQS